VHAKNPQHRSPDNGPVAAQPEADVEKAEALLATDRERADKAITGFEALLRTESERADRAITAFESLAQRLEAMAAQRAIKP
jgi:hypothetical protein